MVSSLAAVIGSTAAAAYLAGTVVQARSFLSRSEVSVSALVALACTGLVCHGIANYLVIYSGTALNLRIYGSASLVSWIMLVFVLLAGIRLPVQNLLILVLPAGIIGVLVLLATPDADPTASSHGTLVIADLPKPLIWHILISIAAYSVLFMSACQSVLLALLEQRLKSRSTLPLLRLLPPLETMETLLFDLLWTGIAVLTAAIVSGFVFLDDMFEQHVVHHTVLTSASWVLYAMLLAGHRVLGWRGTTAVRWTLIAFGLLVLGYFGSKFVIEVLLEG